MGKYLLYMAALCLLVQANLSECFENLDSSDQLESNDLSLENLSRDGFLVELEVSLESAIVSCRKSVDHVVENLSSILQDNDDHEDSFSDEPPPSDLNKLQSASYFDKEFDFIRDVQLPAASMPKYAKDLQNLLNTMEDACLALSTAFPAFPNTRPRHQRSIETVTNRVKSSLTMWIIRWLPSLDKRMNTFLESCLSSDDCESSLEELLEGTLSIIENGSLKGFHSLLSEDIHYTNDLPRHDVSSEALTKLQRLVLHFEDRFNMDNSKEGSYWIAENLNTLYPIGDANFMNNRAKFGNSFITNIQMKGELEIEDGYLAAKVPETFLSVALGSRIIQEGWKRLPEKLDKFISLASYLSPAMIRMGGSSANFLHYDPTIKRVAKGGNRESIWPIFHPKVKRELKENSIPDQQRVFYHPKFNTASKKGGINPCEPQFEETVFANFTMKEYDWHFLLNMTERLGWTLLFDLNQFTRDAEGQWDPTNARVIMEDPLTSSVPIIWQLGNEPNSYKHKHGIELTPNQTAEDYKRLRNLIKEIFAPPGRKMELVGPDVTRPKHLHDILEDNQYEEDSAKYLAEFLKNFDDIDAVTWHQYYVDGRVATLEDFTSTKLMDAFPLELEKVIEIRDKTAPNKPIWLTETATAWGGGALGLSDAFAGTFLWLDKLGAAALAGVTNVFRQSFYGGCYALLDRKELVPTPEYWVSVLHKQTTGQGVLLPRTRLISQSSRLYAHCLKTQHPLYEKGAAVVFGMNVGEGIEIISLYGGDLEASSLFAYRLSPPHSDLTSRKVALNGRILEATPEGKLPEMHPEQRPNGTIAFYPGEIAFWVIPQANISLC